MKYIRYITNTKIILIFNEYYLSESEIDNKIVIYYKYE